MARENDQIWVKKEKRGWRIFKKIFVIQVAKNCFCALTNCKLVLNYLIVCDYVSCDAFQFFSVNFQTLDGAKLIVGGALLTLTIGFIILHQEFKT